MTDVASLRVIISGTVEDLKRTLEATTSTLFKFSNQTKKLGGDLTRGLTLPLASIAGAAIKMSNDFNKSMANVGTLIPGQTERLESLKKTVQSLAVTTGKSTKDVAGGLYEVLSVMSDTADTEKILAINAETASAGLTTVGEAVNFTAGVTKVYGDVSADATQKVADLGAYAVQIGKTTFPELSQAIGEVTPIAHSMGVSLEELFATLGTFTGVSGNTSMVVTQMRSALVGLMDPSKELAALYKSIGVASGQALIEQKGLVGALQIVTQASEESGIPLIKFLGRVEGVNLALAASGPQAENFSKNLAAAGNTSGLVHKQFLAQSEGINKLGFQFSQLSSQLETLGQDFGDALAPAVAAFLKDAAGPMVEKIKEMSDWFSKLSPETRKSAGEFIGLAVAVGPVVYGVGLLTNILANLWPLLKLLPKTLTLIVTLTKNLGLVLAGLTKIVWTLVAALAGLAFDAVIIAFSTIATIVSSIVVPALVLVAGTLVALVGPWVAVGLAVTALGVVLYKWGGDVATIVQNAYTAIKTWLGDKLDVVWTGIKENTAAVTGWFADMYHAVVGGSFVPDMVDGIGHHFGKLDANMVTPAKNATNSVAAAFANLQKQVAQTLAAFVSTASAQFALLRDKTVGALFSGGPNAALDVAKKQFVSMAAALKASLNPALEETEKKSKKTGFGFKGLGDDSDKAAKKAERLKDKMSELGDKIADIAKLNNPTAALVKRIQDLLASGKTGNELAKALEKIRNEFSGSEKELKKFDKALDEAQQNVDDTTRRTNDLNKTIADLAGTNRFPKLAKQIEDAFGRRSQMSAEEFAAELQKISDAYKDTDEAAAAYKETLQAVIEEQKTGKSFWDSFIGDGFKNMDPKAAEDFAQNLGSEVSSSLAHALSDALKDGDVIGAIKQLGGTLGETLGGAVFGPFGAAIGGYLGDKIVQDITKIGESTKGTIKGLSTFIDTIFPGVGSAFGAISNAIFGGSKDADTQARDSVADWLNAQISALKDAGRTLTMMGKNGEFFNLDSITSAGGDRFKPGWADQWWKDMGSNAGSAFNSVGLALSSMLGVTGDVTQQIGVLLADNLGGNVDNLRLLIQSLNLDVGAMEDSLIAAGNAGTMSWTEVNTALNGLTAATGDGLVAIGNIEGAFEQLIATGGRGAQSIQAIQNIGIEAMEAGAKSLEDLKARLRASGKFTEAQITQIFQALADNGITSLDQLADVSDRTGGSIIADLEALGFKWGEVADSVGDTTDKIKELDKATENLDGRDVDINVNVHYNSDGEPPKENALGNVFGAVSRLNKFKVGGIVSSPTAFRYGTNGKRLGLMGEAGPEGVLPLKRIGGELGVKADFGKNMAQGDAPVVVNFNIDATGAEAGVERSLETVLRRFEDRIVGRTVETIVDRKRRGGAIGNILSR